MKQGINVVSDAISFDEQITDADLIITGEGKTDRQTFILGKTPFGVAKVANRKGKPVILTLGMLDEESRDLLAPMFNELHAITRNGFITRVDCVCKSLSKGQNKAGIGELFK